MQDFYRQKKAGIRKFYLTKKVWLLQGYFPLGDGRGLKADDLTSADLEISD